jgi:hypothetical protein
MPMLINSYRFASPSIKSKFVAVWELDETSGTTFADATGNGNTMTSHNSPTVGATGKIGKCVTLASASSKYLDCPYNAAFNSASYSVIAWIKRTANGNYQIIFAHDDSGIGWAFYMSSTGQIRVVHQFVADVGTTATITDANWHHVVLTYGSGTAKIYIDGSLSATLSLGAFNTPSTSKELIGANNSASPQGFFNDSVDQIGYANSILTASDVTLIYNGGSGLAFTSF